MVTPARSFEGVQTATDVGVEEGVFEFVFDAGSFAAIEDAVAIFRGQKQRRCDRKSCARGLELRDAPLHLGAGTGEREETEHRTPDALAPGLRKLKTIAQREGEDRQQNRDPRVFVEGVETEVRRRELGIVEDHKSVAPALQESVKNILALRRDPGEDHGPNRLARYRTLGG